jgi:HK97 family phage major capsid protein
MAPLSMKNSNELTSEEVVPFLIQPLEAASVVLAQRPTIIDSPTGDPLRVPRITSRGDEPGWYAENELIGESDQEFDEVVLLPTTLKSIKNISRFSNELARHAVVEIGGATQNSIVTAVGSKLDKALLTGAGTADGNGNVQVKGLLNIAGIQTGDALDATTSTSLIDSAIAANALFLTAEITNPRPVFFVAIDDYIDIQGVKGADDRPLLVPDVQAANVFRLQGVPVVPTSKLTAGTQLLVDFNNVVVGRDLAPTVKILDQTYANYDQIGVRVVTRFDINVFHPEAVVKLNG